MRTFISLTRSTNIKNMSIDRQAFAYYAISTANTDTLDYEIPYGYVTPFISITQK